ncbi:DUF3080 family protein [Aliidiomarina indica]|uniref:DUF3080 family protein n=1 Tax=Aliidiomarina indica TaxID=2749147 RepID=UPI00188E7CAD|nr:DUF3080 family protein [Aliidiomarina indica]
MQKRAVLKHAHQTLQAKIFRRLGVVFSYPRSVTEKNRSEHRPSALLLLFVLFLSAWLSGCSRAIDHDFKDYQQRLGRLLDEPVTTVELPANPRMPRVHEVQQPIPEISISLLDSMRLDRCRVGQLIAARNSSLGRVQSTQARVLYEIQMITALQECLQTSAADDARLAELLTTALEHKVDTLPLWINRFLTNEDVIRERFRVSRSPLTLEASEEGSASIAALTYFADVFTALHDDPLHYTVDESAWNDHIRTLGQRHFLSDFWRTQQVTLGYLKSLNLMLSDAGDKIGCRNRSVPQQAEFLQNVMINIWVSSLQPKLARLQGYETQVYGQLVRLQEFVLDEAWNNYLDQLMNEESHGVGIRQHSRRHAELYQAFLQQCGLSIEGN